MKVAWRWAMPDNRIPIDNPELRTWVNQSTPLAIDGILYSSSPMSTVSAIDGATGKTLWSYDPKAYIEGTPPNLGFISRGLSYWAEGKDKRILVHRKAGRELGRQGSPRPDQGPAPSCRPFADLAHVAAHRLRQHRGTQPGRARLVRHRPPADEIPSAG